MLPGLYFFELAPCSAPIMPVLSVAALPASQTVEIQLPVLKMLVIERENGFRVAQLRPAALMKLNHRFSL